MGIKSLSAFLRKKCPEIFEPIPLNDFRFKKVAIDISLYLCHYKAIYGDEGWLKSFVKLISVLRENDLHCVFVFDSKAPPEKKSEKEKRYKSREDAEDRLFVLENALENYKESGEVDDVLIDFQKKRNIQGPLLGKKTLVNVPVLENYFAKMRKNNFKIYPNDFLLAKKLFDILHVPYIDAPSEAETTCADLCIQGKVEAVMSEDTDVLAYKAHTFLTKVNTSEKSCIKIDHKKMLESLDLSQKEFLDFCIMCGTDYNKNIPGIGPAKAYNLILKHKNIETVGKKEKLDISVLNHVRIREIFEDYQKVKISVPYCDIPNFEDLQKFLDENRLFIEMEVFKKAFVPKIIFDSQEEEEKEEKDEENDEILVPNIKGLDYIEDFITPEEEKSLLEKIYEKDWSTELKRRTQHYGYTYDYKKKVCEKTTKIPKWLEFIRKRLENVVEYDFNQVIINEYTPGQGISPHTDAEIFGDYIVTLSLESKIIMEFSKNDITHEVPLVPRCLVILSKDARKIWKHSIPSRKYDIFGTKEVLRKKRVSITFRYYEEN